MNKKYEEIDFMAGSKIADCVEELLSYKTKGKLVYGNFNGVTLYSDTVTMDRAYKEMTGMSKVEFDKMIQDVNKRYAEEKIEYEKKIPEITMYWKEKGRKILSEDKWELWDEIVPVRLNDLYKGMELGCCLDIAEILNNNGSLEDAKKKIESQKHSGMSFRLVCSMVKELCLRGNEFFEFVK